MNFVKNLLSMTFNLFFYKLKEKLWRIVIKITEGTFVYPYIFSTYWHYLFYKKQQYNPVKDLFFTARPHYFAGIGHQMANWISGYWWAEQLGLKFAHMPFSTKKWEDFLGFGFDEVNVAELRQIGYKFKRLPAFHEKDVNSINLVKKIIASYQGKKVVFWPPQDHSYKNQYGVMKALRRKFNNAPYRKNDILIFDKSHFNIAVHVRRTVIIEGKIIQEDDAAHSLRWLNNDYYEKVLKQILVNIKISIPIDIYIFSTGQADEFAEFSKYGNVHFCTDMDEYSSFLHLIRADLLITSKSSFSYKPAIINDGIKVCPKNFWHGYPETKDWILVDNDGTFDVLKLKKAML